MTLIHPEISLMQISLSQTRSQCLDCNLLETDYLTMKSFAFNPKLLVYVARRELNSKHQRAPHHISSKLHGIYLSLISNTSLFNYFLHHIIWGSRSAHRSSILLAQNMFEELSRSTRSRSDRLLMSAEDWLIRPWDEECNCQPTLL